MTRVSWRGVTVDQRTAQMLDEVAQLSGSIYVRPTQGSYRGGRTAASAGTHDGCGAVDIITGTDADMSALVPIMRRVGFAAWHRTPAQSSWPHHVHAIAVQPGGKHDRGCLSRGAAAQVVDYFEGRNGLASRAADDGPRDHVGTTWETYKRSRRDGFDMADLDDLRRVVHDEIGGHHDRVSERFGNIEHRLDAIEGALGQVDKQTGKTNARVRKLYRKLIELPAGHKIGEQWRPEDDPVDPGY